MRAPRKEKGPAALAGPCASELVHAPGACRLLYVSARAPNLQAGCWRPGFRCSYAGAGFRRGSGQPRAKSVLVVFPEVIMLPGRSWLSRSRIILGASLALLVGTLACGDDSLAPACSGPVEVTVSGNSPPVIRWTPDCSVDYLTVITPPSLGFVQSWSIAAGERRIESGVRLGQVPSGAVEESSIGFLMSGTHSSIRVESPRNTLRGTASWTVP